MSSMTTPEPLTAFRDQDVEERAVRRAERLRERPQNRHSHALTRLMDTRRDLRGVHALADFVDDSVRWSA